MIKKVTGDLLELAENGEFDVIIHGCNCFTTMGSGIAKQIRERYPDAYVADMLFDDSGSYQRLGNFSVVSVEGKNGPFTIVNAYTQYGFNGNGKKDDLFEYTSFDLILQKLVYYAGNKRIGMPYIGMGLAGGDETRIMKMIEKFANDVNENGGSVTLVKYG